MCCLVSLPFLLIYQSKINIISLFAYIDIWANQSHTCSQNQRSTLLCLTWLSSWHLWGKGNQNNIGPSRHTHTQPPRQSPPPSRQWVNSICLAIDSRQMWDNPKSSPPPLGPLTWYTQSLLGDDHFRLHSIVLLLSFLCLQLCLTWFFIVFFI